MKREEMIGFIVRSLDNMMMRNAVGDEKSEKKGMMPVMQGWIIGYLYDHKEEEIFQRDIEAEFYIGPFYGDLFGETDGAERVYRKSGSRERLSLEASLSSGKRRKTS